MALSEHDKAILNCVFNPNLPLGDAADETEIEDDEESTPEIEESKKLEIDAVKLAENCELDKALEILNRAIEEAPSRPSLYNNRAHVLQFQRKFEEAFEDVQKAILLASEGNHRKTLSQALCQRGVLHRKSERTELAKADFQAAAQLGHKFAKSQLVELNPYAALCNQMLRKVMDTL